MLPRNELTIGAVGRTEPVSRTERIGDPGQEAFQRAMAHMLGKPVQALIASRLADGSFLVKLNDTMARMQLPGNATVGSTLELTLVAVTPRPTFELNSNGRTATLLASAVPAGAQAAASPTASAMASAAQLPPGKPGILASAAPSTTTPAGHILPLPTGASAIGAGPLVTTTPAGNTLLMPAIPDATLTGLTKPGAELAAPGARAGLIQSQAPGAALLGKALPAPAVLQTGAEPNTTPAAPATLSQTAQMLTAVLRAALSQTGSPGRIMARTPIAATPGMAPATLAGALDEAVSNSGLFYESHVAEWSRGQRSIGQLAQEPLMQQMQQLQRAGADIETVRRQMAPTEPAVAHAIDLQLQVQEQQRVAWQGQVWPGQDLRWDIERRADGDSPAPDGQAGEEAASWHSTLTLRFAALGEIGARLVLSGDQILLRLDAGSEEVAALLRTRSGELESALHAGGSFASVSIGTADTADDQNNG